MTVSNHPQQSNIEWVRDLLSPYLDGEVTAEERALVEEALNTSAELRRELETLRQTVSMVSALPPMPAPRPFTLTEADVQAVRPAPRRGFMFPVWLRGWAVLAATLLCVLALGGVFLSQQFLGGMSSQAPAEIARMEQQAAEPAAELEQTIPAAVGAEKPAAQEVAPAQPAAEPALKEAATAVEVQPEMEAPAEETTEEKVLTAGESEVAADESQADMASKASEVAESAASEEDAVGRGAAGPTPSPMPTVAALAVPSATTTLPAAKAMPAEESPAAPPQPSLAEGGAEAAQQQAPAEQNLAQSQPTESPTPTFTPQSTPTAETMMAAAPSPETTPTVAPTFTPTVAAAPPGPGRSLTLVILIGLVIFAALLLIGLVSWLLLKKQRR
jgi:chemotaxis protein histidine kinase CheA